MLHHVSSSFGLLCDVCANPAPPARNLRVHARMSPINVARINVARTGVALLAGFVATAAAAATATAQRLVETTPNLPNSVTALPGFLELTTSQRFDYVGDGRGLVASPTFDLALGLPFLLPTGWTAGVRVATEPGTDEWELYDRIGLLRQAHGAPLDLTLTAAYNTAARSVDGEASLARRAGPIRAVAAARALSNAFDAGEARFAVAGGVVWHPAGGRTPVSVAADVATLLDPGTGEDAAWSVAVRTGLPYTSLSVGLLAGNASTTTLHATSVGGPTRWGFELNAPVEFAGFVLGWFTDREAALRTVTEDAAGAAAARVSVANYLYAPATIRIRAGESVEWVNEDDVVHTVSAENGAFESGAIRPGDVWRARFDEPGLYPYYCGPHPFMKGVVSVSR
jgi:plastocyanin